MKNRCCVAALVKSLLVSLRSITAAYYLQRELDPRCPSDHVGPESPFNFSITVTEFATYSIMMSTFVHELQLVHCAEHYGHTILQSNLPTQSLRIDVLTLPPLTSDFQDSSIIRSIEIALSLIAEL